MEKAIDLLKTELGVSDTVIRKAKEIDSQVVYYINDPSFGIEAAIRAPFNPNEQYLVLIEKDQALCTCKGFRIKKYCYHLVGMLLRVSDPNMLNSVIGYLKEKRKIVK